MRSILTALLLFASAMPGFAGRGNYVFCDNGLRCFKAPCPSSNVLDVATGTLAKGVSIDTVRLPARDRIAGLADDLYAGKLVVNGFIQKRAVIHAGKKYRLPTLVARRVARTATPAESRRCRGR